LTRYAVRHATVYEYGGDVVHSHHLLHLQPREFAFQRCLEHSLMLDPQPSFSREDVDAFGNAIARLEYDRAHERLAVTAEMRVEILPRDAESPDAAEPWDELRRRLAYHAVLVSPADLEACRFRMRSTHVPLKLAFEEYAADCFTPERPVAAACRALMRKIHREFKYVPGSTTNRTSIVDVLKSRRGVCQDFAHFMIGCVRSSGLAARYVSGYIRTVRKGGAAAIGGDASHAWVSVYCPPLGWLDFDPTNDCMIGEDHVTLAWGRDFGDVSPLRGMIVGGGRHKLQVDVRVQPLD
jgi:transglutaminase-like putative cysteine protease